MIFQGSAVALITPFDKNNNVNYIKLKELIEFQIASGTSAIVILGTTGESATITQPERTKIIQFCVCVVSKRVPLIVGTGSNSTETAKKLTLEAETLGADGALIVTPFYNKCNQIGLYNHYKSIAKSVNFPIILYNVPSRTGVNINPETVYKLSKIKNIVGLKEASGNVLQIMELSQIIPKYFALYSGDDLITFPLLCLGFSGVISVTANCYPTEVSNLCKNIYTGKYKIALKIHKKLYKINKALFLDVNPICVKHYMNLQGKNVGLTRLPLCQPTANIKRKLKGVFDIYEN